MIKIDGDGIIYEDGKQNVSNNVVTTPPSGKCKVINVYVDPDTGKLIVQYDNMPV